jgi:phosphatidylglycerol:prolipoprotein diacylglycerol transferase
MRPTLLAFELPLVGRVSLPAYFTLLALGFACALLLTWRDAPRAGLDRGRVVDVNLWCVLWGLLGARLLHLLADGYLGEYVDACLAPERIAVLDGVACSSVAQCAPDYLCNVAAGHCHPPRDCLLALKLWRGGLSYYGGFIAAAAASWYYTTRYFGARRWRMYDLAGYGIPLGLCWGRLGCFLNGCCYGKITGGRLGTTFPGGGAVWRDHRRVPLLDAAGAAPLPVHPTQLYEAATSLALFAALYFGVRPRKRFDGQVFWIFVAAYAVLRGVLEVFRDDDRGLLGGWVSTSQLLGVPLLALACWMLRRLRRDAERA